MAFVANNTFLEKTQALEGMLAKLTDELRDLKSQLADLRSETLITGGLDERTAVRLAKAGHTLRTVNAATDTDLGQIAGIGPAKVAEIRKALGGKSKETK